VAGRVVQDLDARVELDQLVVAAADHAHVVLDHAVAELAELLLQLRADAVEDLLLAQALLLGQRRDAEERAHERRALHAVAQLRVRRLIGAMRKPSSAYTRIFRSRMCCAPTTGSLAHASAGGRSLCITNAPPSASPAIGLEWRNTFASGDSTTFT
jgi:hypothetical protein